MEAVVRVVTVPVANEVQTEERAETPDEEVEVAEEGSLVSSAKGELDLDCVGVPGPKCSNNPPLLVTGGVRCVLTPFFEPKGFKSITLRR